MSCTCVCVCNTVHTPPIPIPPPPTPSPAHIHPTNLTHTPSPTFSRRGFSHPLLHLLGTALLFQHQGEYRQCLAQPHIISYSKVHNHHVQPAHSPTGTCSQSTRTPQATSIEHARAQATRESPQSTNWLAICRTNQLSE